MEESTKTVVAKLEAKLREETEVIQRTKEMINRLYEMEGEPPPYALEEVHHRRGPGNARADEFYGQALATSARTILERNKAAGGGAMAVNAIFSELKSGGYSFDAKDDENAKRGLRISLAKNTQTFHKLPNGTYGLLEWYPAARTKESSTGDRKADADEGNSRERKGDEEETTSA